MIRGDRGVPDRREGELPTTDAEADMLLELLAHKHDLGVTYFVMDFGNPLTAEHVERFAEQVMAPLRWRGGG